MSERRLTGTQLTAVVVALSAAVVLAPAAAVAATTLVSLADPHTGSRAKVDGGKVRVGDGSGALTVDGTVRTSDANGIVYQSPAGGLDCGASSAGIPLGPGTFTLSRYRKLRISVESSPTNQTILSGYARAGSEVIKKSPVFDWTVPAGTANHLVVDNLPTAMDVQVWFCLDAKIFIYGIR